MRFFRILIEVVFRRVCEQASRGNTRSETRESSLHEDRSKTRAENSYCQQTSQNFTEIKLKLSAILIPRHQDVILKEMIEDANKIADKVEKVEAVMEKNKTSMT